MPICRNFHSRIKVFCSNPDCREQVFEDELPATSVINIEEDTQGADILTFICPECEWTSRSRRYG
jgi:hypothetical protein